MSLQGRCEHGRQIYEICAECQYKRRKDSISADFITKDSGERQEFSTGMVRDTQEGKPRYDLIWRPGLKRLAELYERGSRKYTANNWLQAGTQEELDRFKSSANRHFEQFMQGETDEDHMSGTIFNLFGATYVFEKMKSQGKDPIWSRF